MTLVQIVLLYSTLPCKNSTCAWGVRVICPHLEGAEQIQTPNMIRSQSQTQKPRLTLECLFTFIATRKHTFLRFKCKHEKCI